MAVPRRAPGRVGVLAFLCVLAAASSAATDVLFPSPLHLTRQVTDPISGTTTRIDEYCHGNRIVAVGERRTVIADHTAQTVTLIDFAASTWSQATFPELAAANPTPGARNVEWRITEKGDRTEGTRGGHALVAQRDAPGYRERIEVTADREHFISRPALEALLGIGHPRPASPGHDGLISALRKAPGNPNTAVPQFAVPLEWTVTIQMGDEAVEVRNVVTRVGSELPPHGAMTIPPGARRVEMHGIAAGRLLRELDGPSKVQP